MAKRRYGVLRGRVVATAMERNDRESPHYQIMVMADGEPWRVAVNVQSSAKGEAVLLYRIVEDFRHPILDVFKGYSEGFSPVAAGPEDGGLDYIRGVNRLEIGTLDRRGKGTPLS